MANFSLQPGHISANPVTLIPTLFAQAHAAVAGATTCHQLAEVSLEARRAAWDMSAWAHLTINRAIRDRFAELLEARS